MNFQSLCPYGLKSIMECISRATLLSQPTDIPDFLFQYMSELISFRRSHPEADPKVVSFRYQELWEKKFLRNMKGTTETPIATTEKSAAAPQVPSQAEIDEALKEKLGTKKKTGKDKKPSTTPMYSPPTPPPLVGRQFGKNVPTTVHIVKAEGKPAPPPCDVSMKTRRVSSVRIASPQQSKETTDDVKKMPETHQRMLKPILKQSSTPTDVSASKSIAASKPSKLPSSPVPMITQNLVLPPIPQKKTRGDQISVVQGNGVSPKPWKGSPINREVVSEETSSRSPVCTAMGPIKAKAEPKGASVPRPESTQEPREPETESTSAGRTTPKVQEPEKKNGIQPNRPPEKTRALGLIKTKPNPKGASVPLPESTQEPREPETESTSAGRTTPKVQQPEKKIGIQPNRPPEKTRALGPIKTKSKPKGASVPLPESTQEPREPETESTSAGRTTPKVQQPEKKIGIQPNRLPEKTRALGPIKTKPKPKGASVPLPESTQEPREPETESTSEGRTTPKVQQPEKKIGIQPNRPPETRTLGPIKTKPNPKGASAPRPESTQEPREPETESTSAGRTTPKVQEPEKKNRIQPNRPPETRTLGPIKTKPNPKGASAPRPESTQEPREPETESTSAGRTTPKVQEPEKKNRIQPNRPPETRALGPLKTKPNPKGASVPLPESTQEPREPETESTSAGRTTPKVQEPEKNRIQPNRPPEKTRALGPIKTKPKPKGASVPRPESTQEPREPETESTSAGRTTPKVQQPEKKIGIQPNRLPEKTRALGPIKADPKPKGASVPLPESTQEPREPETESTSAGRTTPKVQEPEKKNGIQPNRPPEKTRAPGPIKTKPNLKGASVLRPKSTQTPREPETESTSAGLITPKVQEPEKNWIQPNRPPEKTRGRRVLWAERARVKPIVDRTIGGIQGTAFSRPVSVAEGTNNLNLAPLSSSSHTCPHLQQCIHIIRYRRMQVRSSSLGHSRPSVNSHDHYGL
ncbi:serine/arginine repetitive matrix protein 1-like isoform X2 [Siniperca chuatsi]|uniref:serine/arginine repetitive matrix protein 1-like isoform X2 n=1 Tax=Siniperca chuatsi TaxID=119488 RepID=UPI001CE14099|nr:serine/arginine repetitive matrix protein 1-like isoform X2 [Siniperca chuatsi]